MRCDECDTPVRDGDGHIFEDTRGRVIGRFCPFHCPRCMHPEHAA